MDRRRPGRERVRCLLPAHGLARFVSDAVTRRLGRRVWRVWAASLPP